MSQTSGLTIRQHAREALELRVEFVVREAHREQVRFSPMSSAPQPHVTRGTAQDISSGGMGLISEHYVPRMCEGTVRVYDPNPVTTAADGSPVYEVAFEHAVRVRRVTLASHEPTYSLGLAFIDPAPDMAQQVDRLIALAGQPPDEKGGPDG
ncbi:MAG: PilZ domain-containing protein [Planctomycetota bacterium]|jgi:c-di-GMP-binding flagellar brake protein YcgR